jgi:hypothetical protein
MGLDAASKHGLQSMLSFNFTASVLANNIIKDKPDPETNVMKEGQVLRRGISHAVVTFSMRPVIFALVEHLRKLHQPLEFARTIFSDIPRPLL